MTEEKQFPKPRKLRSTARQSILILGQPDFLYKDREINETLIHFDGKKKSLGRLSDDVHLALCGLARESAINITRETTTKRSPVRSLIGFPSISIQKHRKDTMLVVQAADEAALMEKISKLKESLESKGAITQERCNWICIADKAKVQVSNDEILKRESVAKIQAPKLQKESITSAMSEKTRSLHDIAVKSIKQQEKSA